MSTYEQARESSEADSFRFDNLRAKLTYRLRARRWAPYAELFVFMLVAICVSVYLTRAENSNASLLVFIGSSILLAAVFTGFVWVRLAVLNPRQVEAQRFQHDVTVGYENLRTMVDEVEVEPSDEVRERAFAAIDIHLSTIIDGLAAVTSKFIRAETAVSVKLFCLPADESDEPYVMSLARDTKSETMRKSAPVSFPYSHNSAFEWIVQQRSPKAAFACADLLSLDRKGLYKNGHENWRRYYTSTLVVPISDETDEDVWLLGFLCIDSYAGDVTSSLIRQLVFNTATELYRTLALIDRLLPDDDDDIHEPV